VVLPHARQVLGTRLRKLARGLFEADIETRRAGALRSAIKMVRLPGIAPGHPPWRGDILLLNHNRGN
jgi:hypothetical protein